MKVIPDEPVFFQPEALRLYGVRYWMVDWAAIFSLPKPTPTEVELLAFCGPGGERQLGLFGSLAEAEAAGWALIWSGFARRAEIFQSDGRLEIGCLRVLEAPRPSGEVP